MFRSLAGILHGHLKGLAAQQLLHHIQVDAVHDEIAGEGMPEPADAARKGARRFAYREAAIYL